MGAKKVRDVDVLDKKAKKLKNKVKKMRDFGIDESKVIKIEEAQERYETWLEEVQAGNDY